MAEPYELRTFLCGGAALGSILLLGACARETAVEPVSETTATVVGTAAGGEGLNAPPSSTNPDDLEATAGDVLRNPATYDGRVVTVTGDVDRVISPTAFVLDSGLASGDLLVLSNAPVPVRDATGTRELLVSDAAIVTGRVMNMVVPEVEREIGWDLQREIEVEFENRPVMIVEKVSVSSGE